MDILKICRDEFTEERANLQPVETKIKNPETGENFVWYCRPLNGNEIKLISKQIDKEKSDVNYLTLKIRALDQDGNQIFRDVTIFDMRNSINPVKVADVIIKMNELDGTDEDIKKN